MKVKSIKMKIFDPNSEKFEDEIIKVHDAEKDENFNKIIG